MMTTAIVVVGAVCFLLGGLCTVAMVYIHREVERVSIDKDARVEEILRHNRQFGRELTEHADILTPEE